MDWQHRDNFLVAEEPEAPEVHPTWAELWKGVQIGLILSLPVVNFWILVDYILRHLRWVG